LSTILVLSTAVSSASSGVIQSEPVPGTPQPGAFLGYCRCSAISHAAIPEQGRQVNFHRSLAKTKLASINNISLPRRQQIQDSLLCDDSLLLSGS
jgi:hypothetical protein